MTDQKDVLKYEKELRARFKSSKEELRKDNWSESKINLLEKHLGFYFGLINGTIFPKTNNHLEFIENVKNKKITNIHEEAYLAFDEFLKKQRLLELSKSKEKKLNAIEEYEVGLKPYGIEVDNSDRHLTEEIDDPFRSTYSFKGKKTK